VTEVAISHGQIWVSASDPRQTNRQKPLNDVSLGEFVVVAGKLPDFVADVKTAFFGGRWPQNSVERRRVVHGAGGEWRTLVCDAQI